MRDTDSACVRSKPVTWFLRRAFFEVHQVSYRCPSSHGPDHVAKEFDIEAVEKMLDKAVVANKLCIQSWLQLSIVGFQLTAAHTRRLPTALCALEGWQRLLSMLLGSDEIGREGVVKFFIEAPLLPYPLLPLHASEYSCGFGCLLPGYRGSTISESGGQSPGFPDGWRLTEVFSVFFFK